MLQWLIATFEKNLENVPDRLLPQMEGQCYLVSQQDPENRFNNIPEGLIRSDVQVVRQQAAGLSRNRNHCLRNATGDLVIIADDDVQPFPGASTAIRNAFQQWPEADVLCFQIQTPEGKPYKNYASQARELKTIRDLKPVSSVEIAFRRKSVQTAGIKFDERFGIGTTADHGEELIFLANCLKKGLKIQFVPVCIGVHPASSSVNTRPFYEDSRLFTSGAQNYVLYGKKAYFLHLMATIRRLPALLQAGVSPYHFLKMKNRGCRYIRLTPEVCCIF